MHSYCRHLISCTLISVNVTRSLLQEWLITRLKWLKSDTDLIFLKMREKKSHFFKDDSCKNVSIHTRDMSEDRCVDITVRCRTIVTNHFLEVTRLKVCNICPNLKKKLIIFLCHFAIFVVCTTTCWCSYATVSYTPGLDSLLMTKKRIEVNIIYCITWTQVSQTRLSNKINKQFIKPTCTISVLYFRHTSSTDILCSVYTAREGERERRCLERH